MSDIDLTVVDRIVDEHEARPEALVPMLHALQEHYRYLPREALGKLSQRTGIRASEITGVATFYDRFRFEPAGEHAIRVCNGTACHVKGAGQVEQAIRRYLHIPDDSDTDADRQFTVERVACLGCCTLAPAVQIDQRTYGHQSSQTVARMIEDFQQHHANESQTGTDTNGRDRIADDVEPVGEIRIGMGSCCVAKGSDQLMQSVRSAAAAARVPLQVKRVGCVGMCHRTPLIEVIPANGDSVLYAEVDNDQARRIVRRHFQPRSLLGRFGRMLDLGLERLGPGSPTSLSRHALDTRDTQVSAFFGPQRHIATEGVGQINPTDLSDYLDHQGFVGLRRCLDQRSPQEVIDHVGDSGLRGRGGAGFATARKWQVVHDAPGDQRYIICNGDEGDPGAFMDRMLLESFPFRIIEGMAIAAYAVGAQQGYLYIRAEYPLAVRRVRQAIETAKLHGYLGQNILGSDFSLELEVREGAGAFVCGEETALIASLEGRRGEPRLRPPYPAESGLHGKPTLVNNVETLSNLPWIFCHGADAFAAIGSESSKGTKVFALAGKVRRGGLIEVPMGVTIRRIVEEVGGGVEPGHTFKAVQIGGPSGGCVPASLADTPVDFQALGQVGAIMGSGGLIVLDETDCMVDIARYFLRFTQDQSCGHCTPCRVGTRRMLDILDRLVTGQAKPADLAELEQLATMTTQTSRCGLGQTAPNPVLTTLKYFRDEYEAHLAGRCPAGRCEALIHYQITDQCIGCTLCAQHCPVDAIGFSPYRVHEVDHSLCTRCDACRAICPEHAVRVQPGALPRGQATTA